MAKESEKFKLTPDQETYKKVLVTAMKEQVGKAQSWGKALNLSDSQNNIEKMADAIIYAETSQAATATPTTAAAESSEVKATRYAKAMHNKVIAENIDLSKMDGVELRRSLVTAALGDNEHTVRGIQKSECSTVVNDAVHGIIGVSQSTQKKVGNAEANKEELKAALWDSLYQAGEGIPTNKAEEKLLSGLISKKISDDLDNKSFSPTNRTSYNLDKDKDGARAIIDGAKKLFEDEKKKSPSQSQQSTNTDDERKKVAANNSSSDKPGLLDNAAKDLTTGTGALVGLGVGILLLAVPFAGPFLFFAAIAAGAAYGKHKSNQRENGQAEAEAPTSSVQRPSRQEESQSSAVMQQVQQSMAGMQQAMSSMADKITALTQGQQRDQGAIRGLQAFIADNLTPADTSAAAAKPKTTAAVDTSAKPKPVTTQSETQRQADQRQADSQNKDRESTLRRRLTPNDHDAALSAGRGITGTQQTTPSTNDAAAAQHIAAHRATKAAMGKAD